MLSKLGLNSISEAGVRSFRPVANPRLEATTAMREQISNAATLLETRYPEYSRYLKSFTGNNANYVTRDDLQADFDRQERERPRVEM